MTAYTKWLLPLLLIPVLLAGCAKSNGIKLTYALNSTDSPCSGQVVIFKFEDKRAKTDLGKTQDNETVTSLSDVADWVGWALFDEMESAGCEVKYRTATVMPGDELVVTGEVLELSLNQTGVTTWEGKVAVRIVVTRAGETLHVQKYASQVEDVVMPGYAKTSDVLAEALRGVMIEAVPAISAAARQ